MPLHSMEERQGHRAVRTDSGMARAARVAYVARAALSTLSRFVASSRTSRRLQKAKRT